MHKNSEAYQNIDKCSDLSRCVGWVDLESGVLGCQKGAPQL